MLLRGTPAPENRQGENSPANDHVHAIIPLRPGREVPVFAESLKRIDELSRAPTGRPLHSHPVSGDLFFRYRKGDIPRIPVISSIVETVYHRERSRRITVPGCPRCRASPLPLRAESVL